MAGIECPHCKAQLTTLAAFCNRCGQPIAAPTMARSVAVLSQPRTKTFDQIEYETTLKDQRGCFIMTWVIIAGFIAAICIGSYWSGRAQVEEEKKGQLETIERMHRDGTIKRDYVKELREGR